MLARHDTRQAAGDGFDGRKRIVELAPQHVHQPLPCLPGGQSMAAQLGTLSIPIIPGLRGNPAPGRGGTASHDRPGWRSQVKNPRVIHGNSMPRKAAVDAVLAVALQTGHAERQAGESPAEIKLNSVQSR